MYFTALCREPKGAVLQEARFMCAALDDADYSNPSIHGSGFGF